MAGLDAAAHQLKHLVGGSGFIRRDRYFRALFVSDYPNRLDREEARALGERLEKAGWLVRVQHPLALLDWPLLGYRQFFSGLQGQGNLAESPASGLCRILERHPAQLDENMLEEARKALLLWDSGQSAALTRLAGEALAVRLRKKQPAPHFFLFLLQNARQKEA